MSKLFESWRPRSQLIAARWVCVVAYGVLGAFGALVLSLLLAPVLAGLSSGLVAMGIAGHVVIAALTLFLVGYLIVKLSLFRPAYLKNLSIHPPLLVSVLISVCILMVMQGYLPCAYAALTAFIIFTMCLVMGLGPRVKPCSLSELSEEDIQGLRQDTSKWTVEEITRWIKDELPNSGKKETTQLFFGHEKHVQRIFNRLIATVGFDNPPKRTPKSLALIGPFGSGKTSIINALKEIMRENAPNWIVCKVDAWARSPADIDEQILDLVLDSIAEFTDVTGLRSLPSNYHAALLSQKGWWAFFSHLASGDSSTESKLKKIDDILLVLDKSLLIVIEDPDRGPDKTVEARMERMLSLIDRLQQFTSDRIKVIVSGGQGVLNEDHRAFEYVEAITTRTSDFLIILNTMVDKLWCAEPHDLVLPYGKPKFTMNDFPFGSPRDFKFTLRDVTALWGSSKDQESKRYELRGEVDLQQLVSITFAKHLAPKCIEYLRARFIENSDFQFCRSHHAWSIRQDIYSPEDIQKAYAPKNKKSEKEPVKEPEEQRHWEKIYQDVSARERVIVNHLVQVANDRSYAQSVLSNGRTDYLNRIENGNAEQIDSLDVDVLNLVPYENLKDQEYLRAMEAILNGLNQESRKPNFQSEDIKKLVLAGSLNPCLYNKMRSEGIGSQAWINLADAIIDEAATIDYSDNIYGHPAAAHLIEILNRLFNVGEKDKSEELMYKSLDECPDLAVAMLVGREKSMKLEVFTALSDLKIWEILRGIMIRFGVLKELDRAKPSSGIWFLYGELVYGNYWRRMDYEQSLACLLEAAMGDLNRLPEELEKDIRALEIFKSSLKNLKKMAEIYPNNVGTPNERPADRAIFLSPSSGPLRETGEQWLDTIYAGLSVLTVRLANAKAEPSE